MVDAKHAKPKLAQIILSNDTIHDRIKDMAEDIHTHVVEKVKRIPERNLFVLDESADASDCAQLVAFARNVYQNET